MHTGFADAGANVVIAARGLEKIESVVAEIEGKGNAALGVPTDITDPDAVRALVERSIERFRQVDILMNVVGGSQGTTFKRGPLLELTKHDFNEAFNINVTSAFLCSQAVVPHMLERGGGVIINMASIGARDYRLPETGMSVYNMTKAAVMHLTRSMAKEWAPTIRVNCINGRTLHHAAPRADRAPGPAGAQPRRDRDRSIRHAGGHRGRGGLHRIGRGSLLQRLLPRSARWHVAQH